MGESVRRGQMVDRTGGCGGYYQGCQVEGYKAGVFLLSSSGSFGNFKVSLRRRSGVTYSRDAMNSETVDPGFSSCYFEASSAPPSIHGVVIGLGSCHRR